MSTFTPGWYAIKRNANGGTFCLKFRDAEHYTAKCRVDANGRQFLLWHDPAGPSGPGRPGRWLPSYELLPNASDGDWWDNPPSSAPHKPKNAGDFSRGGRTPTARELAQRASAADVQAANGLSCTKEIHVGIFFDGTNNNMDRDRPSKGHTNVVTLYDAHKRDQKEFFRYYIPGVGTRFAEIGEFAESDSDGNTFASGGEARIHYGMLQVFNAVCTAATGNDLLTQAEMKSLVTSTVDGLRTWWRLGDSKMISIFRDLNTRLLKAVEGKRPKVCKVNVSVIGFSRGAAEARTFVQWIQQATGGEVGGAVFSLRFLGIFDTVASVALADSSPIGGSGFMDWADGNLDIAGVEHTAHFVAAHEIRRSFPLSTARAGGVWPSGVKEFVYPGAHADVGGGYSPGEQGKAMAGRPALLAQIPLNDMFFEALNAGVKIRTKSELTPVIRAEFAIDPSLDKGFSDYAAWTIQYDEKQNVASVSRAPEDRMRYHTRLYWRWRASISTEAKFKALSSYTNAPAQDKIDLWEAELDWQRDIKAARWANEPTPDVISTPVGPVESGPPRSHASDVQKALLSQVALAGSVPTRVPARPYRHARQPA